MERKSKGANKRDIYVNNNLCIKNQNLWCSGMRLLDCGQPLTRVKFRVDVDKRGLIEFTQFS